MRSLRALCLAVLASCVTLSGAFADTRIFLIDSSDGYGVDGCLSAGAPCGERIATAWCRTHDYTRAIDFGRVANDAFTPISAGALARAECNGSTCPPMVAITCSR